MKGWKKIFHSNRDQEKEGVAVPISDKIDFKTKAVKRDKDGHYIMIKENLQPRLLYPARISFKYEGEIKSFTDKQKLREFSTTKPALQQMLKDFSRQETEKVYELKRKTTE